ncbi:bifunctional glutamate--cysteine ligase GshA/glutathione synthetase GshB [Clostridium sp.]|uniref:bifunctional glutamate--cysteine ligase GshA/glutathione synthetase GshB n=1 Tax=Clostridium sp. TaxID=1506 RepID=UPI003F38BF35
MLKVLKTFGDSKFLLEGKFGIERESLRVNSNGKLSLKPHPDSFGGKLSNPYITTDFSESQVELITPTFNTIDETYKFLNALYDIVALGIEDEYLWPQSMPCDIPENDRIPIAEFCECKVGSEARAYREKLLKKYGGKKQLISGIHYNFSFNEIIINKLYKESNTDESYKEFRNNVYLKVVRNYLKYRWLLIYLLGGAAIIHESYDAECASKLDKVSEGSFSNIGAISYRNSECGYKNKIDLFPDYNSVKGYVESVNEFVREGLIDSHKELYSQIRLKAYDNNKFLQSLLDDGINYLEIRSIDINPFSKTGISLEDLNFINIFTLFLLVEEEDNYDKWQEEALYNQNLIARYGEEEIILKRHGKIVDKNEWAIEILNKIKAINDELNLGKEEIIDNMIEKVVNPNLTYAHRIKEIVKEEGYVETYIGLAKEYKKQAYENRFKLQGYEDLELSTQILMKEAIKRGVKVEVLDREDNFISLKARGKVEYVKQATKTSKDNYVTVLVMENKVVTKAVLKEKDIKVPSGDEFTSIEEAKVNLIKYANKPVVIKPKSTNFGIGISIFPNGANEEDLIKGFEIAFENDKTVLIEEFIKGKEYRFLVVGDEVLGILHRVPANVIGNGNFTIRELVEEKNKSSLRGKGYKTPLEKIQLDKSAELFLKQVNKDFDYIPAKDEVVYLRENSNISTGGDSVDYTDDIPEKFKKIAVEASKAAGAVICGVDMILEDYNDINSNYAIIELNFNPAIHIHSYPYKGKERNIAEKILTLLDMFTQDC